ncbi:MAG TPA: DnaB-like helicase C-terminal domain-containing protein, partial [Pseudobdellovibrionaceae bacterium]|nr:DnaB-like helicase C-terminal domain-containing protein [Pseudobdellovibrionaceae bacterium]
MSDEINYKELFNRAKSCFDDAPKVFQDNEHRGRNLIPFGISFLDGALDGILPNDLILIGAATGAGKTTLATQLAK